MAGSYKILNARNPERRCIARIDGKEYVGEICGDSQRIFMQPEAEPVYHTSPYYSTGTSNNVLNVSTIVLPTIVEIGIFGQQK